MIKASFFEAYLDESGTHEGSPILAVAGYFGTHDQWNCFLDNWKHPDFHAQKSRFDSLRPDLVNAINASGIEGAEVCVRPHEFKTSASALLKSSMGNAYAVSAVLCVTGICKTVAEENPDARIAIVLEDGQPNIAWVQRVLIAMIPELPMIAGVTVVRKDECPQLHPADFLSHLRSTNDVEALELVFANGRTREMAVEADLFVKTSAALNEIVRRHRRTKAKDKRNQQIMGAQSNDTA